MLLITLLCCVTGAALALPLIRALRARADVLDQCERKTCALRAKYLKG